LQNDVENNESSSLSIETDAESLLTPSPKVQRLSERRRGMNISEEKALLNAALKVTFKKTVLS
jgi:hypothetical protein